jgi:hypothetical protein
MCLPYLIIYGTLSAVFILSANMCESNMILTGFRVCLRATSQLVFYKLISLGHSPYMLEQHFKTNRKIT